MMLDDWLHLPLLRFSVRSGFGIAALYGVPGSLGAAAAVFCVQFGERLAAPWPAVRRFALRLVVAGIAAAVGGIVGLIGGSDLWTEASIWLVLGNGVLCALVFGCGAFALAWWVQGRVGAESEESRMRRNL